MIKTDVALEYFLSRKEIFQLLSISTQVLPPWLWRRQWQPTPVFFSCLENPIDGGAWWVTVHSIAKSQAQLSKFTFTFHFFMHWRRKWQPTPVFLPGGSHEQKTLVGCRLWGCTESDTTEVT